MTIRARQHAEMSMLALVAASSSFALYGALRRAWLACAMASRRMRGLGGTPSLLLTALLSFCHWPGLYDRRGAAALLGAKEEP